MPQCSQNEKQNEKKVNLQRELLQSQPYPQQSSRSWHRGWFPEAGQHQGGEETRQEPAALPTPPKSSLGSTSDQECRDQSRHQRGASERVWCGCLRGRARRKGIVTLPAWEVSSTSGHHPLRRSLAVVSTWQKVKSSLLTRLGVTTQESSHENVQPPRSQYQGVRAFH